MRYIYDNIPYSLPEIRSAHPNMSIPEGADLSDIGYLPIEETPPPELTIGYDLSAGEPEEYAPGHWRETWIVQPSPPAPIPSAVSRFQARAALLQAGMLETVTALMTADTTDPLARLAWSEVLEFRRDSPTIATMAAALGLTDAQLDALFVTAAGISA